MYLLNSLEPLTCNRGSSSERCCGGGGSTRRTVDSIVSTAEGGKQISLAPQGDGTGSVCRIRDQHQHLLHKKQN